MPNLSSDSLVQCSRLSSKLSPGNSQSPLPSLQYSSSRPTPYICLSHSWDSPDNDCTILVSNRILKVRKNFQTFLDIGRTQFSPCLFWIDALCIGQPNAAERDHQVQRIRTIFAKTRWLVVWLGYTPELERPLHVLGLGENQPPRFACKSFY